MDAGAPGFGRESDKLPMGAFAAWPLAITSRGLPQGLLGASQEVEMAPIAHADLAAMTMGRSEFLKSSFEQADSEPRLQERL